MSDSLNERLNKILPRIVSDDFLSGCGIGNEIAFYIFDYPPEDELRVRDYLRTLLDHIPKQKYGLRVKHIDLFDFVTDYLKNRKLLDKVLKMQRTKGDAAVKEALDGGDYSEIVAAILQDEIVGEVEIRSRPASGVDGRVDA